MEQTSVLWALPLLLVPACLPSPPAAAASRQARDSPQAACSHCVAAPALNSGWPRVSAARVMAGTRFVATSKRSDAVVAKAQCDAFRRNARLQSLVKGIRHSRRDFRVVDRVRRARSNSAAADRA